MCDTVVRPYTGFRGNCHPYGLISDRPMLAVRRALLLLWPAVACVGLAAPIRNVVVSGGTHGNEYTGVYVIEKLEGQAEELRRSYPSLDISLLLANPRAHASNQRFVDADLNRMFTAKALANKGSPGGSPGGSSGGSSLSYEAARGQEIESQYGPKGECAATDLCVDLHTTTSNMGCTIIVDSWCPLAQRTAAYLLSRWDDACDAGSNPGLGQIEREKKKIRECAHPTPLEVGRCV